MELNSITSNLLYKNVKDLKNSYIFLNPNELLNKDSNNVEYLNINLNKTELKCKFINSMKLSFVSKRNNENFISDDVIDTFLSNVKYNLYCGPNLILNDNFCQDEDFLRKSFIYVNERKYSVGIVLPLKNISGPLEYISKNHGLYINITNIQNLLPIFNDLELKLSYSEIEFEKEFEESIFSREINQIIETKNNKFNLFKMIFGMGVKYFQPDNMDKENYNKCAIETNNEIIL